MIKVKQNKEKKLISSKKLIIIATVIIVLFITWSILRLSSGNLQQNTGSNQQQPIFDLSVFTSDPNQSYTNLQPSHSSSVSVSVPPYSINDQSVVQVLGNKLFITTARGSSMRPTSSDSDNIIMIEPQVNDIKVGDIISVRENSTTDILHRVVEITSDGKYITKGDNNTVRDPEEWSFSQINGKVVGILY